MSTPTCEFCWDRKHYRCRGCGCSVCGESATRPKVLVPRIPRPPKTSAPKGTKAKDPGDKPKRTDKRPSRYKRVDPATRKPCGPTPWALAPDERHLVYVLHQEGNNITKIAKQMNKPRSQIKSEVGRIGRGQGVMEFPLDGTTSL